ncbi:MAG: hypothetical protein UW86_C0031G0001, partial [Microgenomates group bacterium GW2011_GWA1_Microgenomates_45_10]
FSTCNQAALPNFSSALAGQVGPYLTWTTFNTNPALTDAQLSNPANPGRRYVGNPAIDHAVTGSPTGQNSFSVTGPGLSNFTTNLFGVSGRLADTTGPVITIIGLNPVEVAQNAVYIDAGTTALDDFDGIVVVTTTGLPVDTAIAGPKTVTYTATDRSGNTTTATRTVNIAGIDTTAPVITILGVNPVDVIVGTTYIDAGATATDNVDPAVIVNSVSIVDTSVIGVYTVTYTATDAAGNAATPVIRIVNVVAVPPVDITAPNLLSFSSTTADGTYGTGAEVNITANFNEALAAGSTVAVTLDNGVPVELVALSLTSVSGTYMVGPLGSGENSPDLTVASINSMNVTDIGGNLQASTVLPASNIANTSAIVIDTTVPPLPPAATAAISGQVFNDIDADRFKDAIEPVLPGWTVYLDANNNRTMDIGEVSVISNILGAYQFPDLIPGTYIVNEVVQLNWAIRLPGGNGYTQTVAAGDNITGKDFGNIVTQTIGGQSQGGFATTTGTNLTSSIVSLGDSIINIPSNGGTSKVTIPADTVITASTGEIFDATTLAASDPAGEILSGLGSGVVVKGKLQWGVPNLGLVFSTPITLEIFVGEALNGQTISILRSVDGTTNWTSDGIVAPAKCTVTSGICSFQATKASYYVAAEIPTTSSSSSNSSSSSSSGGDGSSTGAPVCGDTKPASAPILSVASMGGNEVTLSWTKASDPVTYYLVAYGTNSGNMQFGNPNVGGKDTASFSVKGLSGGQTYFFQVRAGNNCMPGDFSNEVSATPGGEVITGSAEGFTEGVLGEETQGTETEGEVERVESALGTATELPGAEKTVSATSNMLRVITPLLALLALVGGAYVYRRRAV